LKIAFLVTRADTIGGSHIHVRDMAVALKKEGMEAEVLMGGNGPIVNHFRSYGISPIIIQDLTRNISPIHDLKAHRQIKEALVDLKPDLVSTHSSKAGFLGRMAAHKLKIPVLFTAHGWSFTTGKKTLNRWIYRQLENYAARLTDVIITVSDYDRELALKYLNISAEQVTTIHNGMPEIENVPSQSEMNDSAVHIAKVARFDHQKDHMELLNAIAPLDGYHLHFIGDGPLMDDVKLHSERLMIADKITWYGRLDSVDEVLNRCHFFALISNWEGFPRSTLEAMRSSLPVIVSDVGGASEAIEEGKTGFVVQKGDVATLRERLSTLINNPAKRSEMGRAARVKYEKEFTFQTMYQKTKTVYQQVLTTEKV
jgi:glycosyltransferase involved in cell wall biosynthesis